MLRLRSIPLGRPMVQPLACLLVQEDVGGQSPPAINSSSVAYSTIGKRSSPRSCNACCSLTSVFRAASPPILSVDPGASTIVICRAALPVESTACELTTEVTIALVRFAVAICLARESISLFSIPTNIASRHADCTIRRCSWLMAPDFASLSPGYGAHQVSGAFRRKTTISRKEMRLD
jgi:hypothetical protein